MPDGHKIILNELLTHANDREILNILDAGSGITSLEIILSKFKNIIIDAIVYPGDLRKINSIKSTISEKDKYNLIECDICKEPINQAYDLVVSHLLLGEATKFGNRFETLFIKLMTINFKYLILIDYLEDKSVDYNLIEQYWDKNGYNVMKKVIVENDDPQDFTDFVGKHNIGFLVQRK
jgi:hypothetical protein